MTEKKTSAAKKTDEEVAEPLVDFTQSGSFDKKADDERRKANKNVNWDDYPLN